MGHYLSIDTETTGLDPLIHEIRLLQIAPVEVVSLCDVDKRMVAAAADLVATRQRSKKKPRTYSDYREMLKEKDLDIVIVGTPDHWHCQMVLDAAKAAGLVGRKRVLDSTPLYDAVATMDTITLIRSAVRNLLKVTDGSLRAEVLAVLTSGDDYASSDKPQIDWEDAPARERLVDTRAKDAYACLLALEGRELTDVVTEAARLLATVVGQDLEEGDDKILRIARKVAKDRVISVVDPEARHGHKTSAHGFDGYKGHVAIDPDSEIITATTVSAGNAGDASVAEQLIGDLLENDEVTGDDAVREGQGEPGALGHERATVYGDAAYGTGELQSRLKDANIASKCKTQPPVAKNGLFTKDRFLVDLGTDTVTCPNDVTVKIRRLKDGDGIAKFATH